MNTAVRDDVLSMERLIPAPPQKVFELWTDPEKLVKWWGPEGFAIPAHALDVRPGGSWRTTMKSPDGSLFTVSGIYRTIDPPRRLVFTWAWDDDKGTRCHETEVTVMFHAAPGGTRLTLVQQRFETVDARDNHIKGWTSSFEKLARLPA
jgi:uncharacterized protein YndB with AHSA1/START domain